ncbi:MAG: aspartate aminotransferase family protein, partial [Polynucleobacter victoriensis]
FGLYFSEKVPTSYADVTASDIEAFKRFFHLMLDNGVYLAPSAYEAVFISIAHDDAVLAEMFSAAEKSFAAMAR